MANNNESITFKLEGEIVAQIVVQVDSVRFPAITLDNVSQTIIDAVQAQIYETYAAIYSKDLGRLN